MKGVSIECAASDIHRPVARGLMTRSPRSLESTELRGRVILTPYFVLPIILLKRPGHVIEGLHEETLEEEDDHENNNGREVDAPDIDRESPSDPVKHGFSD